MDGSTFRNPAHGGTNTLDGGTGIDTLDGVTEANTAPTTSGIADQEVLADFDPITIDLTGAFDDAEHPGTLMDFAVVVNTNPTLIAGTSIDANGILTITSADSEFGATDITVRATDPFGLLAKTTFSLNVVDPNTAPTALGFSDITVERFDTS